MTYFVALREEDVVFLAGLLNEKEVAASLHNAIMDYNGWLDTYHTYWKNDTDEQHFIIYSDDAPVGWLKLNGLENVGTAWVSMLAISAPYQRRGFGRSAISFSEDFLKSKGFAKIGIHTTDDNIAAHKLYGQCGYVITEHGACTTGDGLHRMGYTFMKTLTE